MTIKPIPRGRKAWKAAWDKWFGFDTNAELADLEPELREVQAIDRYIANQQKIERKRP
jgi:hypothetical protein